MSCLVRTPPMCLRHLPRVDGIMSVCDCTMRVHGLQQSFGAFSSIIIAISCLGCCRVGFPPHGVHVQLHVRARAVVAYERNFSARARLESSCAVHRHLQKDVQQVARLWPYKGGTSSLLRTYQTCSAFPLAFRFPRETSKTRSSIIHVMVRFRHPRKPPPRPTPPPPSETLISLGYTSHNVPLRQGRTHATT